MPGKRQPTDVILAGGKKHLSRAEENQRRDQELLLDAAEEAVPPAYLPKSLCKEFCAVAQVLIDSGIYSDLDGDCLAMYLICRERWKKADTKAKKAIAADDVKTAKEWTGVQGAYFSQAMRCATEMGLTISSRCRLVVPEGMRRSVPDSGTGDEFTRALNARKAAAGGT